MRSVAQAWYSLAFLVEVSISFHPIIRRASFNRWKISDPIVSYPCEKYLLMLYVFYFWDMVLVENLNFIHQGMKVQAR